MKEDVGLFVGAIVFVFLIAIAVRVYRRFGKLSLLLIVPFFAGFLASMIETHGLSWTAVQEGWRLEPKSFAAMVPGIGIALFIAGSLLAVLAAAFGGENRWRGARRGVLLAFLGLLIGGIAMAVQKTESQSELIVHVSIILGGLLVIGGGLWALVGLMFGGADRFVAAKPGGLLLLLGLVVGAIGLVASNPGDTPLTPMLLSIFGVGYGIVGGAFFRGRRVQSVAIGGAAFFFGIVAMIAVVSLDPDRKRPEPISEVSDSAIIESRMR